MSTALAIWDNLTVIASSHPTGGAGKHIILAEGDVVFPDPPPAELPGKAQEGVNQFIGYLKTGIYSLAVISGLLLFMAMIAGMRGRSNFAKDAVTHFPWLIGGVIGAGALTAILDAFA